MRSLWETAGEKISCCICQLPEAEKTPLRNTIQHAILITAADTFAIVYVSSFQVYGWTLTDQGIYCPIHTCLQAAILAKRLEPDSCQPLEKWDGLPLHKWIFQLFHCVVLYFSFKLWGGKIWGHLYDTHAQNTNEPHSGTEWQAIWNLPNGQAHGNQQNYILSLEETATIVWVPIWCDLGSNYQAWSMRFTHTSTKMNCSKWVMLWRLLPRSN